MTDQGSLPLGELCLAVTPPLSPSESRLWWMKRLLTTVMLWNSLLLVYHFIGMHNIDCDSQLPDMYIIALISFTSNAPLMFAHLLTLASYGLACMLN